MRADVELAVLAFLEAVRPGHDHAADRVGAHDVAVVVDLDPLGRGLQAEGLAHGREQLGLGGAFRQLAAERLAGVGQGVLHQLALFAALRAWRSPPCGPAFSAKASASRSPIGGGVRRPGSGAGSACPRRTGQEGGQDLRVAVASCRRAGNRRGCPSSGRRGRRTPARRPGRPRREGEDVGLLDGLAVDACSPGHRRQGRGCGRAGARRARTPGLRRRPASRRPASSITAGSCRSGRPRPRRPAAVVLRARSGPTQGAEQRLIWCSRHGRVRLSKTLSEHERSRNAFCRVLSVRFTAQARGERPEIVALDGVGAAMLAHLRRPDDRGG